jgi:hypothetical protein
MLACKHPRNLLSSGKRIKNINGCVRFGFAIQTGNPPVSLCSGGNLWRMCDRKNLTITTKARETIPNRRRHRSTYPYIRLIKYQRST